MRKHKLNEKENQHNCLFTGQDKKIMKIIVASFTLLFIITGYCQRTSKTNEQVSFSLAIKQLEKKIDSDVAIGGWEDLINIPDLLFLVFTQNKNYYFIFKNPELYHDEIIKYLKDPAKKWEYKYYVLGFLQGQCLDKYLRDFPQIYKIICSKIDSNLEDISKLQPWNNYPYIDMLYLLIDQCNLSNEVIINYKDPLLIKYLTGIKNDSMTPKEIKDLCSDILDGTYKKSIEMDKDRSALFKCKKYISK